jgi:hypothetical protein
LVRFGHHVLVNAGNRGRLAIVRAAVRLRFGTLAALGIALASCGGGSADHWTDAQGRSVPNGRTLVDGEYPLTLDMKKGSGHCDLTDVLLLDVVWPLGTVVTRYTDHVRQYVWDPDNSHGFALEGTPERDATPPEDAVDTAYRFGEQALWIAPSDAERHVYVRQSDGSYQRWPRSQVPLVCS